MLSLNGKHAGPRVAVDAMGGDHAPHEVIAGAVEAQRRGVDVILVGPSQVVKSELERLGATVPYVDASEIIGMDEPVTQALRKRDSSLHVAARLVADGDAEAAVSCGNSAAIMGVALKIYERQPGIDRPAFGGTMPAKEGNFFVLDIGANSIVESANLVQFAIMGDMYRRVADGLESPRVALLSNGSEAMKGTKTVKEAYLVLERMDLNFVGNVEANTVFDGGVDVVVTDGFTGNIFLKAAEGAAMEIFAMLKKELTRDPVASIGAWLAKPAFKRVLQHADFEEYGGAPVLGVNGIMINCHGRSRAKAVTIAIQRAERIARERLVERIGDALHSDKTPVRRRRRLVPSLHLRHE